MKRFLTDITVAIHADTAEQAFALAQQHVNSDHVDVYIECIDEPFVDQDYEDQAAHYALITGTGSTS